MTVVLHDSPLEGQSTWDSALIAYFISNIMVLFCVILVVVQSVSSPTGEIMDEFSLVKPQGWTPNYKGGASSGSHTELFD